MGERTGIAWCDHTFNPVWGCTPVSPACDHCYAEEWARRFGVAWGPHGDFREFSDKHWGEPLRWNRAAERAGRRARVFCASMADVFDKRWPAGVRARLWALIRATPHLDWLLLTKRPQLILGMLPDDWGPDGYPNVWLGTTTENQVEHDRRVPPLRAVPARIRFLSVEPMLGPVAADLVGIHWVICGGESGREARPMQQGWAEELRDQCASAAVPFFFKQWGTWLPGTHFTPELQAADPDPLFSRFDALDWEGDVPVAADPFELSGAEVYAVGKSRSGNDLCGRQHEEFPA